MLNTVKKLMEQNEPWCFPGFFESFHFFQQLLVYSKQLISRVLTKHLNTSGAAFRDWKQLKFTCCDRLHSRLTLWGSFVRSCLLVDGRGFLSGWKNVVFLSALIRQQISPESFQLLLTWTLSVKTSAEDK